MTVFILRKKIELSDLGDDWKDCYITLRDLTVEELQKMMPKVAAAEDGSEEQINAIKELIGKCFIEGKGFDGQGVVEIKSEDIGNLPLEIYRKCFDFLAKTSSESQSDIKKQ